ncbi:MAG: hypothetical protein AW07_02748 [Candidatus Accumulibacter sp. SK-11]|nr:MAG: hypothetical protein AW07_02748 [Candidatus Accumulibacter sp. SK-11]
MLRRVVVGCLVEEVGAFRQHQEAMGEAGRNPQLFLVLGTELMANPAAEGWRALAQVDRDVEDGALHDQHQLALGFRRQLVVQSAQDVLRGS